MITERTSVGLDGHACSTAAAAIDERNGELTRRRMGSDTDEIVAWVTGLPGPFAATYEAGLTGFGLARVLTAAGAPCVVAAPSKLQCPMSSSSASGPLLPVLTGTTTAGSTVTQQGSAPTSARPTIT